MGQNAAHAPWYRRPLFTGFGNHLLLRSISGGADLCAGESGRPRVERKQIGEAVDLPTTRLAFPGVLEDHAVSIFSFMDGSRETVRGVTAREGKRAPSRAGGL